MLKRLRNFELPHLSQNFLGAPAKKGTLKANTPQIDMGKRGAELKCGAGPLPFLTPTRQGL